MKYKKRWLIGAVIGFLIVVLAVIGFFVFDNKRGIVNAEVSSGTSVYMVAGLDEVGQNTDMMLLVSFNRENGSIRILQLPRDTYCKTEKHEGRINQFFRRFTSNYDRKNAAEKLCMEISDLLDIKIDGYVIFPLSVVETVVNMLGGVQIDVPCDMSYVDPEQDLTINIPKGTQKLTGEQAVKFVRFRSGYVEGDLGRMDAQMLFFSAFLSSLQGYEKIPQYLRIYQKVAPNLLTNLKEKDIITIIMVYLKSHHKSDVYMMRLPGEACLSAKGAWYYIANRPAALQMLRTYFSDCYGGTFDKDYCLTDAEEQSFTHIYLDPNLQYRVYTPATVGQMKIAMK